MEGSKNVGMSLSSCRSHSPLIGYYLSKKKLSKLRFDLFLLHCKCAHIETIELSRDYFDRPNYRIPQLIVHKLDDEPTLRRLIEQIRCLSPSTTIILDRFESIAKLLDRFDQYSRLKTEKNLYDVPSFIRVESGDDNDRMISHRLDQHRISYPILCKPIQAHGEKSHQMKIIFDAEHLDEIDKPCVLQQFVDHNGILFKVFAIGPNNYHIVRRNSIRNLHNYPCKETIAFHSSEVSSSQADHILLATDTLFNIDIDQSLIQKIAHRVQNIFQLNLVGIDIIIDRHTGLYAVIDVNYFPGYEGVEDFSDELFHLCQHLLQQS